jgi:ABC-type phosphate/phosphonate transport system substrate-binding protein
MLAMALTGARAHAGSERVVVFYDPDANHQAILNIIASFNGYLHEVDPSLVFQPVQSAEAFERVLHDKNTEFAILSSEYLRADKGDDLTPLLVPASKGDIYYRKLLVDLGQGKAGELEGQAIAATLSGDNPQVAQAHVLDRLRDGGVHVKSALIIPVSKDIDALLALSFGQVKAALVTASSIEVMQRINPSAVRNLRIVYQTAQILRSPLCAVDARASAEHRREMAETLRKMATNPEGQRAMLTMGFDAWMPYENGMMKR